MSKIYQVVLCAEDGEYIKAEFTTQLAAYNYLVANRPMFGEGQELFIVEINNSYGYLDY